METYEKSIKKYALTRANVYSTQVASPCQQGKNGYVHHRDALLVPRLFQYDTHTLSPETPSKTPRDIAVSSLFDFGELAILAKLPKNQKDAIIKQRLEASDKALYLAQNPQLKEEKTLPQKRGEPDWKEVEHDARVAFSKRLMGEG